MTAMLPSAAARPGASRPTPAPPDVRGGRGDGVLAVVGLSVVVSVALWLAGRGGQDLFGSGAVSLTSLGRVTGLVASDLLLRPGAR